MTSIGKARAVRGIHVHARLLIWCALLCAVGQAGAFGFQDVAAIARKNSDRPYQPPGDRLTKELREMDYDDYRDIRFKASAALWHEQKLPFEVMFFHMGRAFKEPVRISEVVGDVVKPVPFDPDDFDYGRNKIDPQSLRNAGFAGFRLHYAINKPQYKDEVAVFLGASYFRAVGKGQVYGLSARGLAIDTAGSGGEEFPRFTDYWLERPGPKDTALKLYAVLDSPRMTGAYEFLVKPGGETVMTVRSTLYPRTSIDKVGIAPLTSMFQFGENQPGQDDYRPEVHDSDGLSVWTGEGEWIWRPLVNPKRLLVTSFSTTNPKGFGLMQRDRTYADYEDTESIYERRPSLWIEPLNAWGAGRVELVQIPTPDETNDNIVAYWVAQKPIAAHEPVQLSYRMHWQMQPDTRRPQGWVVQTRRGRGYVKQPDGQIKFVVDFDGPQLRAAPADTVYDAVVGTGGNGEVTERNLYKNPVNGTWRMTVRVKRADANRPVELRAVLKKQQETVSETWSYIVPAEGDRP